MTKGENEELAQLRAEVAQLREANRLLLAGSEQLIARNMMLAEKVDIYNEVRRRVEWLKDLVSRHRELMAHVDLRDDDELLAFIETRLESDDVTLSPEFGLKDVAELAGTTQQRIVELYRRKSIYHSVDKYLDYLRLIRALRLLKDKPLYGIEAIAQEAGFNSVRTMHRKILDTIGLTPGQFRDLTNPDFG